MAKKSLKTAHPPPTPPAPTTSPHPWPLLSPSPPPSPPNHLLPSQIVTIPNFLTTKDCATIIRFSSTLPFSAPRPPGKDEALRSNYRWQGSGDNEVEFMGRLWERLNGFLVEADELEGERLGEVPAGLCANVRVYRYEPGQLFHPHYDESTVDPRTNLRSGWTLLVYLSGVQDGVVGGQTVFYPEIGTGKKKTLAEPVVAELERGTALLHRHGRMCMLHEARPVEKGVKWVLRSDVLFAPRSR